MDLPISDKYVGMHTIDVDMQLVNVNNLHVSIDKLHVNKDICCMSTSSFYVLT